MAGLSRKKKGVLAAGGAAVAALVFALLAVLSLSGNRDDKDKSSSAVRLVIPDAEDKELVDTKTEAYKRSAMFEERNAGVDKADDIWMSLVTEEKTVSGSDLDSLSLGAAMAVASMSLSDARQEDKNAMIDKFFGEEKAEPAPKAAPKPAPKPAPKASPKKTAPKPKKVQEEVRIVGATADAGAYDGDDWGDDDWNDGGWDDDGWGDAPAASTATEGTAVRCMLTQDEKIRSGQRVMLRLLENVDAGGIVIPKNTRVAALATLSGGRMNLVVSGYQVNGKFYAVNLVAYDSDGSRGLYCPTVDRSADGAASQAVSTAGTILSNSMGSSKAKAIGTLVNAALSTGQQVAQKELSKVVVNVPSGYTFYLRNEGI